jgi:hypothetical protein
MTSNISHSIKHRASPKDVFYTPIAVVKTQLTHIKHRPEDNWYDPFYGAGVYYNNFPTENKVWTEIAKGKDFFTFEGAPDIICSNPPYSMIDAVLAKSIALKPRIISYLLLHGAMTPKRMESLKVAGYGLTGIYTCKVYSWYGMAEAYTFTKGADWSSCEIHFDRTVHRIE